MCRPTQAGVALRRSPLMKACWTNAACVEGIPLMTASTCPAVFLSRRPIAQRAPDAGTGGSLAGFFFYIFVGHYVGGIFYNCTHDENYERETAAMP